jgi:hypothetical protein
MRPTNLVTVPALGATLMVNTDSTYDWQGPQWSVPINFMLTQLLKVGKQPISLQLGYRYYAEGPSGGPDWDSGLP